VATNRKRWFGWALAGTGGAAVATALYVFPPEQARFLPRCAFHALTGLQCPGCGGLRASHHLLHGHFATAWQLNPLIILGAILGAVWLAAWFIRRLTGRDLLQPVRRAWIFWAALGGVALFGIARNLLPGG
jgi:hypothetical protein